MSKFVNSENLETFAKGFNQKVNTELAKKVDKVNGKSLIDDSEIVRLKTLDNYDDTEVRQLIDGKAPKKHGHTASEVSGLSAVATSGAYEDLSDVPTKVSQFENDKSYATTTQLSTGLAGKSDVDHVHDASEIQGIGSYVTDAELAAKKYATQTELTSGLDTKVDKKDGYSLMSNSEITRLAKVDNYNDEELRGRVGSLETGKSNVGHGHKASEITGLSKVATSGAYGDLSGVPTKLSQFENDSSYATTTQLSTGLAGKSDVGHEHDIKDLIGVDDYVTDTELLAKDYATNTALTNGLNTKVDKVSGKSLILDTEIKRLATLHNYNDSELRGLISDLDSGKSDVGHGHNATEISGLHAVATSGKYTDLVGHKTKLSEFSNDTEYITAVQIPTEYVTETELLAKDYATQTQLNDGLATKSDVGHTHDEYLNKNAFAHVKVGTTNVSADVAQDTLTIVAGNAMTITPDADGDSITIAHSDTSTATSVNNSGKNVINGVSIDGNGHVTALSSIEVTPTLIGASPEGHTHSAYVNQNAFSNVKFGETTIAADSATDTLNIAQGNKITLAADSTNDKLTIGHAAVTKLDTNNTGAKVIQNITFDGFGHPATVTATTLTHSTVGAAPAVHQHELEDIPQLSTTYATKTELTQGLAGKSNTGHGHKASEVNGLADVATSGAYGDLSGVPTKVSQFTNDAGYLTAADDFVPGTEIAETYATKSELSSNVATINTNLGKKVDKVKGKSLLADSEIERLATLKNYDDTAVRNLIAGKSNKGHTHVVEEITDFEEVIEGKNFANKGYVDAELAKKSNNGHAHDDRYYTETEIDTKLTTLETTAKTYAKDYTDEQITALINGAPEAMNTLQELATAISDHQDVYDAYIEEVETKLAGKSDVGHTHDDRYYTEDEIDTKLTTLEATAKGYTDEQVGAHTSNTGIHVAFSTAAPKANTGTSGSVGTAGTVARSDHAHPLQTTVSGNAGSATKLQTARKINGTNFDGTGDIATANWGTARDITIGNETKSVNGSAAVIWTLEEIGAAEAGHTHAAYVNQNAFSNVKVGTTTVSADSATDTLELAAGTGIVLTPDTKGDKVTIAHAATSTASSKNPTDNTVISGVTIDGQGHVTALGTRQITPALIGASASDHTHNEYVNKNAFANITVGKTTIAADVAQDTLTIVAGNAMTITPDADGDSITIAHSDTCNISSVNNTGTTVISGVSIDGNGHVTGLNSYEITPDGIGAAKKSHGTHVDYATAAPKAAGTAAVGTSSKVAREDHVHPVQTSVSGNAGTATKLANKRTINGTEFDGTGNITTTKWGNTRTITIGNSVQQVDGSGDVNFTLASIGAAGSGHTHDDRYVKLNGGGSISGGVVSINTGNDGSHAFRITRNGDAKESTSFYQDDNTFHINVTNDEKTAAVKFNLSAIDTEDSDGTGKCNGSVTISMNSGGTSVTADSFIGSLNGNAKTATNATKANSADKLTTAVNINGTAFDGTNAITTSTWGNARTLTIGNKGKSVNGTQDISWSLSDIGAAPVSHASTGTGYGVSTDKNYGHAKASSTTPKAAGNTASVGSETNSFARGDHVHPVQTSVTGNAGTATKLATAVAINGTNFDGSADIITANWGTARNISIVSSDGTGASTAVSVNGSAAVSLKLPATIKASITGNVSGSSGSCTGNAATATTLKSSRTFTVGNTGKTFNGSKDVSWTLDEIGAAAKGHEHITDAQMTTTLTNVFGAAYLPQQS